MQTGPLKSKYSSALKIAFIFLGVAAIYIVFSDIIILHTLGKSVSAEKLSTIQSYKGLGFVFVTSVLLFILIQREINKERTYIKKLEAQQVDLKKLSEEKTEASQKFETLFKYNPTAIVISRLEDGIILDVNDSYCSLFGYSREELLGKTTNELSFWKDENDRKKMISGLLKDGFIQGFEARAFCKDGKLIDTLSYLRIVKISGEKIILAIILDITELKNIQNDLKDSREQLQTITNNLPGAVIQYRLYPDGRDELTFVSEGAESIWGVSPDEAQRNNEKIWTQMDKQDLPKVKKSIEESARNLTPWSVEYRNILPDKTEKWIQGIGLPKKMKDGSVVWDSIMLDITSRKIAEKNLQESQTLLEKTINSLNEAVFVVNPDKRKIKLANDAVEKLFGYKKDEIIGKSTEFLHVDKEMFDEFGYKSEEQLAETGVFHTEFKMKHKNGKIIETENTVKAIKDSFGWKSGVVSVIRDITSKNKAQRQIEEYQDSLKQLTTELSLSEEKQRKKIAANIHDHLSQLLVISRMKLNDLKDELQTLELKKGVDVITNHISLALENSRKITYDLSPPVLYELGLVETMYWLADKVKEDYGLNVSFISDFEEIELPDEKLILIFRIIQELVNNAIKHARSQNLDIIFKNKNTGLEIIVKDDGVGFVTNGISATRFKKDGFGLFTVKERINNLQGKFVVNSNVDKGTKIEIWVPLDKGL